MSRMRFVCATHAHESLHASCRKHMLFLSPASSHGGVLKTGDIHFTIFSVSLTHIPLCCAL
eukprot:737466-Pleurochrysis_carterae.AAC.2